LQRGELRLEGTEPGRELQSQRCQLGLQTLNLFRNRRRRRRLGRRAGGQEKDEERTDG
jgi:hypothetical protein